jgi:hypothetical protein
MEKLERERERNENEWENMRNGREKETEN